MSGFERPVAVIGMKELQRALKELDGESQKELRLVLNDIATTIAQGAARRVPVRTGRARGSLRAKSSQREAKVSAGGRKAPYYGWLDFGGTVGRGRVAGGTAGSVRRRWIPGGRYIYPTVAANRAGLEKALADGLTDLAKRKGLA